MSSKPQSPSAPHLEITFEFGTLVVRERHKRIESWTELLPGSFVYDARIDAYRGPAIAYRELMVAIVKKKIAFTDTARTYERLELRHRSKFPPRDYQQEALEAWCAAGKRGTVVLPTGAGKSFLAELAMNEVGRPTLIVTPTIDLMNQWYDGLEASFGMEIGLLGGGYHEIRDITVTTYDSAYIHMERLGGRFGLIVFDEVHHLPGASYAFAAESCIAPYRLGLTATPERSDGLESRLDSLVGAIIYEKGIRELAGLYLADYSTVRVDVELSDEELHRYQSCREIYVAFRRKKGIQMSRKDGWQRFIAAAARSKEGRRAWHAYREQRKVALQCRAKLDYLEGLLRRHKDDRIIIFTNDNDTVYEISRLFLLPAITHQTQIKERKDTLQRFNTGEYPAIVTSRVLNEGVNVPEANIAVILSGTGSVREHVQRLGRILRQKKGNKKAILYELIAANTGESFTSERRRNHEAYR